MELKVIAAVQEIVTHGKGGPKTIATSKRVDGPIMFSLSKDSWQEERWPQENEKVVLFDIRKVKKGFKASGGRFLKPSESRRGLVSRYI